MKESNEELIITYKDSSIILNERLLDSQDAWDSLSTIKELHIERMKLDETMKGTTCKVSLQIYDKEYTEIEFKLQDAWGFPRAANYHKFWERSNCGCSKLDNEDRYPSSNGYYMSMDCLLHGA